MNAEWHKKNPMPKRANMDQRIKWHQEHAQECDCREMPATVKAEIERRVKAR